jgi:hypothetical protein
MPPHANAPPNDISTENQPRITYLPLDQIKVGNRCRKEVGDLAALMASMRERGLLRPLLITPDRRLLAGYRRLQAGKRLGYARIQLSVVGDVIEALKLLRAERAENTCRQSYRLSEAVAVMKALCQLEGKPANERSARPGKNQSGKRPGQLKRSLRNKLAEVVSDLSGKTLEKAEVVVDAANAHPPLVPVCEEMDRTGKVHPAYKAVLQALGTIAARPRTVPKPSKPITPVEESIDQLAILAKRIDKMTRADFYRNNGAAWINEKKCVRCRDKLVVATGLLQCIVARIGNFLADPLGKETDHFGRVRHAAPH